MSTLAVMKARIADEMGQRTDLTTQIGYAINDAITACQDDGLHFMQSRQYTFTTVAGQEFYDAADQEAIGRLASLDFLTLVIDDSSYDLEAATPKTLELASVGATNTGQPIQFAWYGDKLRLYPAPSDPWVVRLHGSFRAASPASDSEANNPWMTTAERLIRSRAKLELALHVTMEQATATAMGEAVAEAMAQLVARTNRLKDTSGGFVKPMEF